MDKENFELEENLQSNKSNLEEEKLRLEIVELKKIWFKKPAFFVPFFGTISSLFILWITGFFDTRIQKLNFERTRLTIETQNLEKTKEGLLKDSVNLEIAKDKISKGNLELKFKNDSMSSELDSKKKELDILKRELAFANKPVIDIILYREWFNKKVGISIINNGTGTAYIKTLKYFFNDKYFPGNNLDSYKKLLEEMNLDLANSNFTCSTYNFENDIYKANALKSNGEKFIISLSDKTSEQYNIRNFLNSITGLRIEIEYQSADKKIYKKVKVFTSLDTK